MRASKTASAVSSAPRAGFYHPHEPRVGSSAPVRDPAADSSASAHVSPPGRAPSFGIPGTGLSGSAKPRPNAPAPSALAPSAIDHGLAAKGTRPGAVAKVASVALPAMEKGLVTPKTPVAPIAHKIEIVPRPVAKPENCGDDKAFVACPTLKIRYDTPYTSEDPE